MSESLKDPADLTGLTHFIACGHGCWGRGESIREAIKAARAQGSGRNAIFAVWKASEGASVDGLGYIRFGADDPSPVHVGNFDTQFRVR